MPFDLLQQLLATVCTDIQIALGDKGRCLQILPTPGIAERPEIAQQITAPQAVDHDQQMDRQREQPVGHRLDDDQQQSQQRHRQQDHHRQHQPWPARKPRAGLKLVQLARPATVTLNLMAQGRELFDPHRQ
ncbi:hypothetical protein D3C73_641160 [compost metagenome]